jgi:hypothetical protein
MHLMRSHSEVGCGPESVLTSQMFRYQDEDVHGESRIGLRTTRKRIIQSTSLSRPLTYSSGLLCTAISPAEFPLFPRILSSSPLLLASIRGIANSGLWFEHSMWEADACRRMTQLR